MRKTAILFLGLMAVGALTVDSQSQGAKIGFINTLEVLYGTNEGKREIEKLNQFAADKQKEIVAQTEVLSGLQEQYANQQRTLNAETRAEMERDLQEKNRALKRLQEDIQLEYNERRDSLLEKMSEKIRKIIDEYAPLNGYGAIFLRDQTQSYVDSSMEVSQDIIRIYNEQYPVAVSESTE